MADCALSDGEFDTLVRGRVEVVFWELEMVETGSRIAGFTSGFLVAT